MSTLQQDTYTSSDEEDYVFEESNEKVQPVEKVPVEKVPVDKVPVKKVPVKKVPVKKVQPKKVHQTVDDVNNGFSFDLNDDDSSGSEYEEIIVRKKIKKKSKKKSKKNLRKETETASESENMTNMTNFVNQFEGVDPFNFQIVKPGQ